MEEKQQVKDIIAKAMSHVWTDEERFKDAIACFYAFENMGQDLASAWATRNAREGNEQHIFASAWRSLVSESAGEEDEEGNELDITPEHKSWLKDAKKIVATLKKHKMAFTMANAEEVFKNPKKYEKAPSKGRSKKA
jgi:hypothetical protein